MALLQQVPSYRAMVCEGKRRRITITPQLKRTNAVFNAAPSASAHEFHSLMQSKLLLSVVLPGCI